MGATQSEGGESHFGTLENTDWKRRYEILAELAGLVLYEYDGTTGRIGWSGNLAGVTGYSPADMTGGIAQWAARLHPDDRTRVLAKRKDAQNAESVYEVEYRFLSQDGQYRWVRDRGRFLNAQEGAEQLVGVIADITSVRQLQQELERQTRTDALTGTLNRRHFLATAEQELARAARYQHPLSLLLLNVDEFESIQATHGAQAESYVLQQLAAVCAENLRHVDSVGRLADEEFAVLLPEASETDATEIAQRLHKAVEQSAIPLDDGVTLRFTVSIGQVSLKGDGDLLGLLRRAEFALLEAKRNGRNRICIG